MASVPVTPLGWHVALFGAGCLAGIAVAVWTVLNRNKHAAEEFLVFVLAAVGWNVTVLVQVLGPVPVIRTVVFAEQFFQTLVPVTWFLFAVRYTGAGWLRRPAVRAVLALVVAGMVGLESVPPLTEFTYGPSTVVRDPFATVAWDDTPVSDGIELLGLVFATVGSGLLLHNLVTANYARAWQAGAVFVAAAGTILLELFDSDIAALVRGVDYAALAVSAVGLIYVVTLYRYDVFGYTPVDTSDVIKSIAAPVVMINPDRQVIDFNARAGELFAGVARGQAMSAVLPQPIIEAPPVAEFVDGQAEVRIDTESETRTFRLYATTLDSFGDLQGLAVTLRDVTDQRRRQEELDLLKQILSRALRHNIRNELDVVKANSQRLADELEGERRELARSSVAAADSLLSISDKTRTLERVIQGSRTTAPVDLATLCETVVDDCSGRFPETSFVVDCPGECIVETNPDVEYALRNLVENAAKHNTVATPRVRIGVTPESTGAIVTVEDNGPGIPDGELAVLERREEPPLDHGSGMGLWIVETVLSRTDGTISYDTTGDGTTVAIRLTPGTG